MKNQTSLLLFMLIIWGFGLQSQSTIEDFLSAPYPTSLTSSPAQDRIAWVFNEAGARNIWVAEAPGFESQKITTFSEDDGQGIGQLSFSNDGNHLVYVRGGGPNRSGEIPNPTSHPDGAERAIFTLAFEGGVPQKIGLGSAPNFSPNNQYISFIKRGQIWLYNRSDQTSRQLLKIRGRANSLRWSSDETSLKLAFVSNRGDHSYIGIYDFEKHQLNYISPSVDRDLHPVWSPDGTEIAFVKIPYESGLLPFRPRRTGIPWSIWKVNVNTLTVQKVFQAEAGFGSVWRNISANNQIFWGNNNQIIFPWEKNGWTQLHAINANGEESPKAISPEKSEVQYVSIASDKSKIVYSCNWNDLNRQHIWEVDLRTQSTKQLSNGSSIEWAPIITSNTNQLVVLSSSGTTPPLPAIVKNQKIQPIALNEIPPSFPKDNLVEPEPVIFDAVDGMPIHGQLFKPKNLKEGEKRPAFIFLHGGSRRQMLLGFHHRQYYSNAYAMNQFLASQGYIVLTVNYRSGIGYGLEFREAINYGATGATEFNDVLGAGLYLKNRPDVQPGQIGLWGGSYGGYLTALGLAKASDLFFAGVDFHGVHDWNVVIKNFVPSYNINDDPERTKLAFESSPMAHIETWKSPVLLIHGDDDRNVPFSESVDLAESLRKQNVYFEQLVFPDEVHGFLLHRNWVQAYKATADFFKRMMEKQP